MVARINGFTYGQLDQLLREYGFSIAITERSRTYTHPSGAQVSLAPLADDDNVVGYHLTAIRAAFSDYDILPYAAFDMKILPYLVHARTMTPA